MKKIFKEGKMSETRTVEDVIKEYSQEGSPKGCITGVITTRGGKYSRYFCFEIPHDITAEGLKAGFADVGTNLAIHLNLHDDPEYYAKATALKYEKEVRRRVDSMEKLCEGLRTYIKLLGDQVRSFMGHPVFTETNEAFEGQHGEMKANIMLAYRHLEDARMRLGKVMQQIQGGVSIYDRSEVGGKEG